MEVFVCSRVDISFTMEFELNEQQLAIQASVKNFVEQYIRLQAAQWDKQQIFPVDTLKIAGDSGLMSMYVDDLGTSLSRLDSAIAIEALAEGCPSTAAYISIHNMATNILACYGSNAIKQQWLDALCKGEKLASYCLTEANAGSDAASLQTTARLNSDCYLINGSKAFISGAGDTDVLMVMARTGEAGSKGISAFAFDARLEGISYGQKEEKLGWNSQPTRAIYFDNVEVPVESLLGQEGQGFSIAMEGLDGGRINIAACSLGAANYCLQSSVEYVKQRYQFGQAIADFQNTQFKLADMHTELAVARQIVFLAASKLDNNTRDKTQYCAMAKRFATDVGFNICNHALQLHGGYGYIKEYSIERYVRDTRAHQILEGTNEIMRQIIAKSILKT